MPKPLPYNASRCVKAAAVLTMHIGTLHQHIQDQLDNATRGAARSGNHVRTDIVEAERLKNEALLIMRYALDGDIPDPMKKRIRELANEYDGS